MRTLCLRVERSAVMLGLVAAVAATGLAGCATGESTPPDDTITYSAAYVSYDSPESLNADATLVVEGRVVGREVREIALTSVPEGAGPRSNPAYGATSETVVMDNLIYTVATVMIERVLSGDAEIGSTLEVKQLGGTVDGRSAVLPGAVMLAPSST